MPLFSSRGHVHFLPGFLPSGRPRWGAYMLFYSCAPEAQTSVGWPAAKDGAFAVKSSWKEKAVSYSLPWLSLCERCSPINSWYLLNRCLISCVLLGWEPFIEPWPCSVSWQQQAASRLHPPRLKLEAKAKHRLNINITSVLMGEWKVVFRTWVPFWA